MTQRTIAFCLSFILYLPWQVQASSLDLVPVHICSKDGKSFPGTFTIAVEANAINMTSEILRAYKEVLKRKPNAWELNRYNYNDGSWEDINELRKYVMEYHNSLKQHGITIETSTLENNSVVVGFFKNDTQIGVDLVSASDGKILGIGGKEVITILQNSGVKSVTQDGGSFVSESGKKIQVNQELPGVELIRSHKSLSKGSNKFPVSGKTFFSIR